ncbi:Uncharacterised protein [Mycobacteroides abscessus subsp. abscessus]|nr:Uncharacterised protein [Mycobacteroides abscessus subsp. abscessus]
MSFERGFDGAMVLSPPHAVTARPATVTPIPARKLRRVMRETAALGTSARTVVDSVSMSCCGLIS